MKFIVNATVTVSAQTLVEADSEAEAIAIAGEREMAELAHNSLYPDVDEAWHIDIDGEPQNIRVEAV
jgi:hypothetical protein